MNVVSLASLTEGLSVGRIALLAYGVFGLRDGMGKPVVVLVSGDSSPPSCVEFPSGLAGNSVPYFPRSLRDGPLEVYIIPFVLQSTLM